MPELSVKDKSIEKLEEMRKKFVGNVSKDEWNIKLIDEELRRQKNPFKSLADSRQENEARHFDRARCDIWNCEEPTLYSVSISLTGEIFTVFACDKHSRNFYDGRYTIVSCSGPPDEGW